MVPLLSLQSTQARGALSLPDEDSEIAPLSMISEPVALEAWGNARMGRGRFRWSPPADVARKCPNASRHDPIAQVESAGSKGLVRPTLGSSGS